MSENLERLQRLAQDPAAVAWFSGLFKRAHIHVTDTDERFTVAHHGDRVEVQPGFGKEKPNFTVPLASENVRNLEEHFAGKELSDFAVYRIVKFMLRPCLEAALAMPILRNPAVNKILRIDTHWQEALLDPDGNEDEQLTIIFVNNQWLVIPGYHGKPQRRLVFTPQQALDYQRRVFEADEKASLPTWIEMAREYVRWRESVSVPV